MLSAENTLKRPLLLGWSPELKRLRLVHRLYQVFIRQVKRSTTFSKSIHRIQTKLRTLGPPVQIPTDLPALRSAMRRAKEALYDYYKTAQPKRQEFLATLASEKEMTHPAHSKIIRRILYTETNRWKFKRISQQLHGHEVFSSINSLDVFHDNQWITLSNPQAIETALLQRNRDHFAQAQGTPFTTSPLTDHYDFSATHALDDAVLQSALCSSDVNDITKSLLSLLQTRTLPTLHHTFTPEQLRAGYRHWDRTTTTSPSGRHLDHYHALLPTAPEDTATEPFWITHCNLLNAAIQSGTALERWKRIVTCMIPKEKDNCRINCLRIIHLIKVDYNLLLKESISCQLMTYLDRCDWLSWDQYGSRKRRSATDPTFNTTLFHDHLALTRQNAVKFNNDAQACYDWIIPSLANLILQRAGLDPLIARIHGMVLRDAKYYVKTALGISSNFYQHSEVAPVFGTGQGACHSPLVWAIISSLLFQLHTTSSHGANIISPTGSTKFSISGFVDDANNFTSGYMEPHTLLAAAQADA